VVVKIGLREVVEWSIGVMDAYASRYLLRYSNPPPVRIPTPSYLPEPQAAAGRIIALDGAAAGL